VDKNGHARFVRARVGLFLLIVFVVLACAKAPPDSGIDALDLAPADVPFDPGSIVDTASFTDAQNFSTANEIQQFLQKTPYNHASFLTTYVSGGIRASEAIALASERYQINPLVFLVRAEVDGGLIAASTYPLPPAKVEYVFGCGCPGGGAPCDPALGGFDKQVDCLGRALRASLSLACGPSGATPGGWAVGKTSTTIDGVNVTPSSEATAALYQYTPVVAQGAAGGSWMFFNVWQLYSIQVGYTGRSGGSWVGEACCGDAMCSLVQGGTCAVNAPSGMCTASCSSTTVCPKDPDGTGRSAVCGNLGGQGFCLLACNPGPCRTGYKCVQITPIGGGKVTGACLPGP
jgi:hypothetical protein